MALDAKYAKSVNSDPLQLQETQVCQDHKHEESHDNEYGADVDDEDLSDFETLGIDPADWSALPSPRNSSRSPDSDVSSLASTSTASSRTRYLYPKIDTVEPLHPEEARWFYREIGHKRWHPFIGYDSLRVECKYREFKSRVVVEDSKEEDAAELEEDEKVVVRGGLYEIDVGKKTCSPIYWSAKGKTANVMRGSWFFEATWQPIEEDDAERVEKEYLRRFENQKIREEETTEVPTKGKQPVIHKVKLEDFHIKWHSVVKAYLHYETASSKLYRAVGKKLGLSQSGTKVCRSYCHEARMDDKPPDISQLVFVVHGIGQKMDTGSIVKSSGDLRDSVTKLKEKYFLDLDLDNKRVEFLPVEWRSALTLDGDIVETITPNKVKGLRTMLNSSAMDILYYTSPLYRSEITQGLQTELNRLYSMFCVRNPYFEASRGKVSIVAHSLGCVITYDIITGWNPIQLYDQYVSNVIDDLREGGIRPCTQVKCSTIVGNQLYFSMSPQLDPTAKCQTVDNATGIVAQLEEARKCVSDLETKILRMAEKQQIKSPTLKFKLENFICLGSPLAVFLALRGVRPKGNGTQDHILPKSLCTRLFNIYHPSDPVAYRLEPLILKHYATIKPLKLHRHDVISKDTYEQMDTVAFAVPKAKSKSNKDDKDKHTDPQTNGKQEEQEKSKEKPNRWTAIFKTGKTKEIEKLSAEMAPFEDAMHLHRDASEESVSTDQAADDEDNNYPELDYRLDYQLREGKMENAYLSTLTSHTSYWSNPDIALFILQQMFPDYYGSR